MSDGQPSLNPPPALLDAEEAHRKHPRTYSIPRRIVRESLQPGDYVKLLFRIDPPIDRADVERMWVEVVAAADSRYTGRLANQPVYLQRLAPGDLLDFGPEHVAARDAAVGDPLYTDPQALAVVSRRVWDDGAWPSLLERHRIPDVQFSGWYVLAGDESPGYRADPANFLPMAQSMLTDRFSVLDSGLEGPIGTTMTWNDGTAEYEIA